MRGVVWALRDFGVGLALLGFNGAGIVGRALLAGTFGFDGVGVLACGRAVWTPKISFSGRRCPAASGFDAVDFGAFLFVVAFLFDAVGVSALFVCPLSASSDLPPLM